MGAKGQKLTAEQRAKIGRGIHKHYEESRKERIGEPTHKKCAKCGKTKPVSEFSPRRQKLTSGSFSVSWHSPCKKCQAAKMSARRARLKAEGKLRDYEKRLREGRDKEKQRAYVRESKAKRRREEGRPVRASGKQPHHREGDFLETEPLALFLEGEMKERSFQAISEAAGINQRQLTTILAREYPTVSLRTVDRFLTGLGAPEALSILYPEDQ